MRGFSPITFLSKLAKRERLVLYAALTIVALMILDRLIIAPVLSRVDHLNKNIGRREEDIRQSLVVMTQEDRIRREIEKYTPYLSGIRTEEKEMTAILQKIENLAKKNTVYLINIRNSGVETEGMAQKFHVDIECEAQMRYIVNFFYDLVSTGKLFKIEQYHIRPKQQGSSIATCTMTVSKVIIPE